VKVHRIVQVAVQQHENVFKLFARFPRRPRRGAEKLRERLIIAIARRAAPVGRPRRRFARARRRVEKSASHFDAAASSHPAIATI
jgi:hypothetical protein